MHGIVNSYTGISEYSPLLWMEKYKYKKASYQQEFRISYIS